MKSLLLFCLFLTLPLMAANRAILIGVNEHRYAPFNDLPGVKHDLARMKDVAGWLGFKGNEIISLSGPRATLANIEALLRQSAVDVGPQGRVLIYYSGHGYFTRDFDGDEEDGFDELLTTYDIQFTNASAPINSLSDDDFGRLLNLFETDKMFLFLDACYSGTGTRSLNFSNPDVRVKYFRRSTRGFKHTAKGILVKPVEAPAMSLAGPDGLRTDHYVALSACKDRQQAYTDQFGSYFTYGLYTSVKKAHEHQLPLSMRDLRDQIQAYVNSRRPPEDSNPKLSGNTDFYGHDLMSLLSKPGGFVAVGNVPAEENELDRIAARANYNLAVTSNKNRFQVGESLEIHLDQLPEGGYLNIVNIDPSGEPILLFPNPWHRNNYLSRATSLRIPADDTVPFRLVARPPSGDVTVLVLHTSRDLNLLEQRSIEEGLKTLDDNDMLKVRTAMRGFQAESNHSADAAGYGAGILKLLIE